MEKMGGGGAQTLRERFVLYYRCSCEADTCIKELQLLVLKVLFYLKGL